MKEQIDTVVANIGASRARPSEPTMAAESLGWRWVSRRAPDGASLCLRAASTAAPASARPCRCFGSDETLKTYRFHIAKLRWFCEHEIHLSPSRWSIQEVNAIQSFLKDLPPRALCRRLEPAGPGDPKRNVAKGQDGYTPFRTPPSASSAADILRCVHAMFNTFHGAAYMRLNPMQLVKARKARRITSSTSCGSPKDTPAGHMLCARDRFALIALRELGLRSSELVGANMRDLYALSDPKNGKTYWVFAVREVNA